MYVPTAVEPSATLTAEADPAENTGSCSFRSVTVAVTVIVSVLAPSETVRTTVQVLLSSPAPQPGVSKSGADANVSAPVPALTLKRSLSVPPVIEYVRAAVPSASVAE